MVPAVIQSFCWGLFGPTTSWQVKVRAFFAPFLIIQHLELICQRELVVFLDLWIFQETNIEFLSFGLCVCEVIFKLHFQFCI